MPKSQAREDPRLGSKLCRRRKAVAEGLGGQVIGQSPADTAGYEVVDGDEIDFEAVLEVNQADDGPLLSNSLSLARPPHI